MYQHLAPCFLSPIGNYTVYGFIILCIRLNITPDKGLSLNVIL